MHIQLKNPLETNEEINERLSKFEKEIDSVEPDQVDFSTSLKERGKSDFCVHMGDPMVQQLLGKCLPRLHYGQANICECCFREFGSLPVGEGSDLNWVG